MAERRFTDSDVAVILARAADLDATTEPGAASRGLSEAELREIAQEVGIDPEMVGRAVAEFGRSSSLRKASILGPSTTHREIRAVPGRLDQDAIAELVHLLDEESPAQGTIGEALGSVRWSAPSRSLSRQVSFEPSDAETVIRVEERYGDHIRGLLHGIPTFYGGLIGMSVSLDATGAAGLSALIGAGAAVGAFLVGRGLWTLLARRSRNRVTSLADALSDEAARLSPPEESVPE